MTKLILLLVLLAVTLSVSYSEDVCSQPIVIGPCKAMKPKYAYNASTSQCTLFYYGGCQGNDNNFNTIEECEAACGGSSTTTTTTEANEPEDC